MGWVGRERQEVVGMGKKVLCRRAVVAGTHISNSAKLSIEIKERHHARFHNLCFMKGAGTCAGTASLDVVMGGAITNCCDCCDFHIERPNRILWPAECPPHTAGGASLRACHQQQALQVTTGALNSSPILMLCPLPWCNSLHGSQGV